MRIEDSPSLQRLIQEDAAGQLRRREGLMAVLGSEDDALKLDWVEGVPRLLADPVMLAEVENEARQLWDRGIRHVIWAGMGGSVIAVRVFTDLGFCNGSDPQHFTIYPLDSTDPAALNEIVRKIAEAKNLTLPAAGVTPNPEFLRAMLDDVIMIGVSMGMTSEEPITHLEWFADLLRQARLRAAQHLLVMTLPGSYLDDFAQQHQVPTRSLQLDGGTGTGGRMSAPTTRVFSNTWRRAPVRPAVCLRSSWTRICGTTRHWRCSTALTRGPSSSCSAPCGRGRSSRSAAASARC